MVTILNGQQEMFVEAFVEVYLAKTPQCRTRVPIPICKVRVGGPLEINTTLSDGELVCEADSGPSDARRSVAIIWTRRQNIVHSTWEWTF